MSERTNAIEQYRAALRAGQKYYNDCQAKGISPYPRVLEEIYNESMSAARVDMGIIDIPTDSIVGTLASGRKAAFAGNFMPILPMMTEFSDKWINLCTAHLGTEGITDPIVCLEYMGRFYVQEGHKRVSVLKSFGAPTITAHVTRIIPTWSEAENVRAYYEFMDFYKLSGIYQMIFRRVGCYAKLQKLLGFEPDHVWTDDERADFLFMHYHFREVCDEHILESVGNRGRSDIILECLEIYPYDELKKLSSSEIRKRVMTVLPDLKFYAEDEPVAVSTEPEIPEKSIVSKLLDGITKPRLKIAFIYVDTPDNSPWTRGHDDGRKALEESMGSEISVHTYVVSKENASEIMEQAVSKEGVQLMFVTAPTLIAYARKVAAMHPGLMVLVCALTVPFAGVRTYYSRIYEAKFIAGAIAGAMSGDHPIGYIARYPILGVPAAVNAFALGARMVNPNARVLLKWSCLEGNHLEVLKSQGVAIVSGHPAVNQLTSDGSIGWNTSRFSANGRLEPLTSDFWDWGRMYEQIVRGVMNGGWKAFDMSKASAVSYWWGMNSGVIDVVLSDIVPSGVAQLASILRNGLIDGTIKPFECVIRDQAGMIRNDGEERFMPEEIMNINWLCDNVEGHIPNLEELLPMARETTQLLALKPYTAPRETESVNETENSISGEASTPDETDAEVRDAIRTVEVEKTV